MLRKLLGILPLVAALGLGACDDQATGVRGDGARMTVLLTDAPGDFHSAVVTISKLYLHGEEDFVLLDEPFTVDLLDLRTEVATLVSDFELPEGSYHQLRMVLAGGYIEVEGENGETRIYASSPDYEGLPVGAQVHGSLQMPSMGQSGLKVKLPGDMLEVAEGETVVLIDFDVAQSFGHQAGKSGKWVMHPVIVATDVTFGGNVLAELELGTGVVLPELAGALVTLADFSVQLTPVGGGTTRTGAFVDADTDGTFEFMFKGLAPGQYTLDLVSPSGLIVSFAPALPLTVTVFERQTTTETITLSAAALASTVTAKLQLASGVTLPAVGGNATTLAQFQAQLTPTGGSAQSVLFTDANTDGVFEASFVVPAGEYSLALVAPAGVNATFDPTVPVTFTVAAGATETRSFSITAATTP